MISYLVLSESAATFFSACATSLRHRDAELLIERVRTHRAAEERPHFVVGFDHACGRQNIVAISRTDDRALQSARFKCAKPVGGFEIVDLLFQR